MPKFPTGRGTFGIKSGVSPRVVNLSSPTPRSPLPGSTSTARTRKSNNPERGTRKGDPERRPLCWGRLADGFRTTVQCRSWMQVAPLSGSDFSLPAFKFPLPQLSPLVLLLSSFTLLISAFIWNSRSSLRGARLVDHRQTSGDAALQRGVTVFPDWLDADARFPSTIRVVAKMSSRAAQLLAYLGALPPDVNKYLAAADAIKTSIEVRPLLYSNRLKLIARGSRPRALCGCPRWSKCSSLCTECKSKLPAS